MKRLLLGIMMLVTAGAASAEWTLSNFTANYFVYTDIASIRRNGNLVKMWDLMDLKTRQKIAGDQFLSLKTQAEYDCNEEKSRTLAFIYFSEQMGAGTVVYSGHNARGEWGPVSPGSVSETLWKIACGKK